MGSGLLEMGWALPTIGSADVPIRMRASRPQSRIPRSIQWPLSRKCDAHHRLCQHKQHNAKRRRSLMLRRFMLMMGLLVAASLACAGEAGRIVFVAGDVQIAGQRVAAGSAVSEGDELATGSDGYAYMKTVDNGFFILRPNTRARITARSE